MTAYEDAVVGLQEEEPYGPIGDATSEATNHQAFTRLRNDVEKECQASIAYPVRAVIECLARKYTH